MVMVTHLSAELSSIAFDNPTLQVCLSAVLWKVNERSAFVPSNAEKSRNRVVNLACLDAALLGLRQLDAVQNRCVGKKVRVLDIAHANVRRQDLVCS